MRGKKNLCKSIKNIFNEALDSYEFSVMRKKGYKLTCCNIRVLVDAGVKKY